MRSIVFTPLLLSAATQAGASKAPSTVSLIAQQALVHNKNNFSFKTDDVGLNHSVSMHSTLMLNGTCFETSERSMVEDEILTKTWQELNLASTDQTIPSPAPTLDFSQIHYLADQTTSPETNSTFSSQEPHSIPLEISEMQDTPPPAVTPLEDVEALLIADSNLPEDSPKPMTKTERRQLEHAALNMLQTIEHLALMGSAATASIMGCLVIWISMKIRLNPRFREQIVQTMHINKRTITETLRLISPLLAELGMQKFQDNRWVRQLIKATTRFWRANEMLIERLAFPAQYEKAQDTLKKAFHKVTRAERSLFKSTQKLHQLYWETSPKRLTVENLLQQADRVLTTFTFYKSLAERFPPENPDKLLNFIHATLKSIDTKYTNWRAMNFNFNQQMARWIDSSRTLKPYLGHIYPVASTYPEEKRLHFKAIAGIFAAETKLLHWARSEAAHHREIEQKTNEIFQAIIGKSGHITISWSDNKHKMAEEARYKLSQALGKAFHEKDAHKKEIDEIDTEDYNILNELEQQVD